jgi:DNA (cytosine-5)-methyltransferase 1
MIKYASLFSGIGGFELGIQAASKQTGIKTKCVFASEFDPESKAKDINKQPARIIYNKNFGEYPHGDITKINASDVPDCDLIVGGPPCQDFSIAGKRAGLCGTKGSMFNEFIRIVQEKQPRYLLIENVKGILSSNRGWDFAKILIELEDAGYWVEWEVRNTAAYLPQNRERVFIVGHLTGSERSGPKIFPIGEGGGSPDTKEPTVYCLDANYYKGVAQQARSMVLCDSGQGRKNQTKDEIIAPLRANTGAGHNNAVIHSTWPRSSTTNKGGTGHLQRNDGCTYCTDPNNHMAVEMHGLIRRLTPTECELLQGFPRDWTAGVADTNRYKCLGNSVTVPVVADIMEKILK